jgi:5-methylcytosine-specific restriction endonuclease McrA
MKLTPKQRKALHAKYDGHCAYCGSVIPEKGFHADHAKPVWRDSTWVRGKGFVASGTVQHPERDSIDNFEPSCARCNIRKSANSIETFRREIGEQVRRLRRDSRPFKIAEDFGLVQAIDTPVVFFFEKFEQQSTRLTAIHRKKSK